MEIWFKQGKRELRLPILPASWENAGGQDNHTETVNKTGEVNLLGLDKLDTLPISAHFPENPMYYDQYADYPKPQECVEIIEKIKENGVATLLITPYINRQITIESFTWGFKEEDKTGDIYYTIETKRYRIPTTSKGKGRQTKKAKAKTVTVKKGDTWAKLAKKYTGSSKNAKKIQKKNKMTNKKKPPVGKRIVIPA